MNTDGKGVPNKVFTVVNETGPGPAYFYLGGQLHRHVVPGIVFIYGGQAASEQPVSPPQQPTPTTPTPTTPTTGPTTSPTTTGTSAPTTTPTTAPPPTPSTWNETVGGVTHTWTKYTMLAAPKARRYRPGRLSRCTAECRASGWPTGTRGGIASPHHPGAARSTIGGRLLQQRANLREAWSAPRSWTRRSRAVR